VAKAQFYSPILYSILYSIFCADINSSVKHRGGVSRAESRTRPSHRADDQTSDSADCRLSTFKNKKNNQNRTGTGTRVKPEDGEL